jgi:hypothetical protein
VHERFLLPFEARVGAVFPDRQRFSNVTSNVRNVQRRAEVNHRCPLLRVAALSHPALPLFAAQALRRYFQLLLRPPNLGDAALLDVLGLPQKVKAELIELNLSLQGAMRTPVASPQSPT